MGLFWINKIVFKESFLGLIMNNKVRLIFCIVLFLNLGVCVGNMNFIGGNSRFDYFYYIMI